MDVFDPYEFEAIDWDDEEDENGNLAHCLAHGVDELVVEEVLAEDPQEVRLGNQRAEFAVVGVDRARSTLWTLLFDRSYKRGDWLRPVTGWRAKDSEVHDWEKLTGQTWRGDRA